MTRLDRAGHIVGLRRVRVLATLVVAALALAGCGSTGSAINSAISSASTAGVAAGITQATGSALIGTAVGVGAGIGLDAVIKYGERRIQRNAQNAIADAAAPLAIGQSAHWHINHWLPLTQKNGTVEAARNYGTIIPCKDVVFTVNDDDNVYVTTVCKSKRGIWRWALAEPTVDRWGMLQ